MKNAIEFVGTVVTCVVFATIITFITLSVMAGAVGP
jgi:hypothetical protein